LLIQVEVIVSNLRHTVETPVVVLGPHPDDMCSKRLERMRKKVPPFFYMGVVLQNIIFKFSLLTTHTTPNDHALTPALPTKPPWTSTRARAR
jgi:hypothetical protein